MNRRTFKLEPVCPYTRVEYLENIGWSHVFLPIYPKAGDIIEIESELQFTSVEERQAELTNQHPYFFWGVFDDSPVHFYAGIAYNLQSVEHPADTNWHIFKLVSYGENAGFWIDGINYYPGVPTAQAYAPTGFQLWRNLNSTRRCLNRKKWLRITINGRVVMNLLPVLDDNGVPAFYDTISGTCFYNSGEDALVCGPVIGGAGYTTLEYLEGSGTQYCNIPITIDGSDEHSFTCETDIQFMGETRQLMGFATHACCYWGSTADKNHLELGNNIMLAVSTVERQFVRFSRVNRAASLECNGITISRSTEDITGPYATYGVFLPSVQHMVIDICKARIYKLNIYSDNILTRQFIPVLDPWGKCCFYDKKNHEYLYSEGEDTFIPGPVIG